MQNTYQARNIPATSQSVRRGVGSMVPPPAQAQSSPQHQHQLKNIRFAQEAKVDERRREEAKKLSKKPVDKNLPDGLGDIVHHKIVEHYDSLREVERRLDAVMTGKRMDILDSVQNISRQYGTMRIWISNTAANQPWQADRMDSHSFEFSNNVEASYRVRIEGRMLDSRNAGVERGEPMAKRPKLSVPSSQKKFSRFFKAMSVDFDRERSLQPDGFTQIEWKRPDYEPDIDCIEFERKGDENVHVILSLVRDEDPPRFKLSPPLANLLDTEFADRQTVLMAVWEYIKMEGLQSEDASRKIICDQRLREIFNRDHILFPQLPELLRAHLADLPPVVLPYTIRVDEEFQSSGSPRPTVYDVSIPLDDSLNMEMQRIIRSPEHLEALESISEIDDNLAVMMQELRQAKAKHGFMTSMSKDPANFLQRWISSQQRDLAIIKGADPWNTDHNRRSEWRGGHDGVWGSDQAWEGVGSYLTKPKV